MYFKMAFNNVKKSFKDYTIYFLTITFAVCIFYSFNSINDQTIMGQLNKGQAQYVELMNQFISILSIGVSVILGALIIYATNFLIKRRKKEFGIYMTLGMKKRSMSIILFLETLYIGLISLAAGLALGLILAQVLSIFTAKLFVIEMSKYSFVISYDAIFKTICYFGFMYALVMIFNVFVISRYKLIDLLYANKKNEKIKIKNIYLSFTILLASIAVLAYAYYCVNVSGLNFDKIEFKLSIILGILGTLLFFYGASAVILNLLQRKTDTYLNGLNCFSIRQICSKFNTNFLSMTIICLMLLITIGTLACSLSVKDSIEDTLKKSTQFDASVTLVNQNGEIGDKNAIIDGLSSKGYKLGDNDDYMEFKTYEDKEVNCNEYLNKYAVTTAARDLLGGDFFDGTQFIKISDFNKLRQFSGNETIDLKDDEILVASNYETLMDAAEDLAQSEKSINIKGTEYKIKSKELIKDYTETSPTATVIFAFIVPDYVVDNSDAVLTEDVINIKLKGEDAAESEKELSSILSENANFTDQEVNRSMDSYYLYGMTKSMCIESARGLSTIILFISVYIGIVFLLASAAVLALQQLSSCNESVNRYDSLRKIGATKKMINRSILIQVAVFFCFPLFLAVIHSIVGVKVVNSYLVTLGSSNQLKSILLTAFIMVIVYGGYLYGTYISYKNVIDNEFN